MLILGHVGLTLGAAALLDRASRGRLAKPGPASGRLRATWISLAKWLDIRLLLVGSLLPDIIDKPVGLFLLRDTFSEGRIFSHTLVFLILISLAGFYLYRRRGAKWLLVLAFGSLTHLVFDYMWRTPRTLFWPVFGFAFERGDVSSWVSEMLHGLLTKPEVYVPELLGGLILVWFGVGLLRRRMVFAFMRRGLVE